MVYWKHALSWDSPRQLVVSLHPPRKAKPRRNPRRKGTKIRSTSEAATKLSRRGPDRGRGYRGDHSDQVANGAKRMVEPGGAFGGGHGYDPSTMSRRAAVARAKAKGLQGGEQCPGCDNRGVWEECDVYKDGWGKGSDGN
jgi:hypothetical protein